MHHQFAQQVHRDRMLAMEREAEARRLDDERRHPAREAWLPALRRLRRRRLAPQPVMRARECR